MNFIVDGLLLKGSDSVFVGEEAVKNKENYPLEKVSVYISDEEVIKLYERLQKEKEEKEKEEK